MKKWPSSNQVKPNQRHSKPDTDCYVYGKHVVDLALERRPGAIRLMYVSERLRDERLLAKVRRAGLPVKPLDERRLPGRLPADCNHQGLVAVVDTKMLLQSYQAYWQEARVEPRSIFLILSEVQDPQNVGAMIRTAAAFGVQAVLLPKHKQAPLTGTVAKVSAGMVFTVPIVEIGNLNTTLSDLQKRGVLVCGLAAAGESMSLYTQDLTKPLAFVVGNEATGLRQQTRQVCDTLLHIPMHPRCESLNASAAVVASLAARAQQYTK